MFQNTWLGVVSTGRGALGTGVDLRLEGRLPTREHSHPRPLLGVLPWGPRRTWG